MSHTPLQTPMPQPPPLPEHCRALEPAPSTFGPLLTYLAVPFVAILCVLFAPLDPLLALILSGATMAAFWIGYSSIKPQWMTLQVTVLTVSFYAMAVYTKGAVAHGGVLWMASSAVAGAVGAVLTRRHAEEDDLFFLPLGAALLLFLLLVGVGLAGSPQAALDHAAAEIQQAKGLFQQQIDSYQSSAGTTPSIAKEVWAPIMSQFGPFYTSLILGLWTLSLWFFGRLARRLTGQLKGHRPAIIIFRIRQPYIFLLILGLILEIFSILSSRGVLSYVAWPLLSVVAVACFFEGLGVVLFLLAIRRMMGRLSGTFWMSVLGVAAVLTFWQVGVVLGLADVWFDFRKLKRLRQQIEPGPWDQTD